MEKVSIIIPTYNVSSYIEKCLDSVVNQTYQNIEIVIVDDCSTDNTFERIKNYDDSRITVIQNDVNHGPSYSRNLGISKATGSYIALLDGDDWWDCFRLEKLMNFIGSHGNIELVFDDIFYIEDKQTKPWSTFLKESMLKVNEPRAITMYDYVTYDLGILKPIIKKEFLTRYGLQFNEEIHYGEDFLFFFDILTCQAVAYLIPQPFYYYRSRVGSLVTTKRDAIPQLLVEDLKLINSNRFDPKVVEALEERKRMLEFNLFCETIKIELKKGRLIFVLKEMINQPCLFLRVGRKLRKDVKRMLIRGPVTLK